MRGYYPLFLLWQTTRLARILFRPSLIWIEALVSVEISVMLLIKLSSFLVMYQKAAMDPYAPCSTKLAKKSFRTN